MGKRHSAIAMAVIGSLALLFVGYSLERYPKCEGGCQNFAYHLIQHGWEDLLSLI